ncbi:MAG TPA: serine hydrolase [Rudaea sp.]|jgi:CubicO group peptidase (beta-lactamase class C family)
MRCPLRAKRAFRIAAGCLFILLAGDDALAAPAPLLPDSYRRLFDAGTANGAFNGVAIGLIHGKEQQTVFFGNGAAKPAADSVFEIGAATDVFTGILLAQAAIEGKLRLADPLRGLLPSDFPWADADLGATPLVSLATQKTGFPATPPNLFPANADDPYAGYREADLLALLANVHGKPAPHAIDYSTLNAGLLGLGLARLYDTDYPALLASKILLPLGMTHSGFDDPPNLLPGHALGQASRHWHYGALAGAAGLRSTLADLLAFVGTNLQPGGSSLRAALLLARQSRADGPAGGVGLGWDVHELAGDEQTWPMVWRASQTGGFSTFIGFRTDRQQGLVLLADSVVALAPIGLAWLSDEAPPAPPRAPYVPTPAQIARYPGLYRLLDGSEVTVRASGAALTAQVRGQPEWPLFPVAEDIYSANGGGAVITFVRNIDEISGLLLRTNGIYVNAERLTVRAPRLPRAAIAIEPAKLSAYAGDYLLEAGVLLRVCASSDGLVAQFTGSAPTPMHAYARDAFADADGVNLLTFQRDENEKISDISIELAGGERKAERVHWRTP